MRVGPVAANQPKRGSPTTGHGLPFTQEPSPFEPSREQTSVVHQRGGFGTPDRTAQALRAQALEARPRGSIATRGQHEATATTRPSGADAADRRISRRMN